MKKWVGILIGSLVLVAILIFVVPYVIVTMSYSSMTKDDSSFNTSINKDADEPLKLANGKYLLAFSEWQTYKNDNAGALYVVNEEGEFLSHSKTQNISEPLGIAVKNDTAYIVNKFSPQRSMLDLNTGVLSPMDERKDKADTLSFYVNKDYIIYDQETKKSTEHELVYWKLNNPDDKKTLKIKQPYTDSIFVKGDDAYITSVDPDAVSYIQHIDLKNNKLVKTKLMTLEEEEYSQNGLETNDSLIFYKGYLYYTVNKLSESAELESNIGKIVKIDPKTLDVVKKIPIDDEDFNPDSLAVVNDELVILDDHTRSYVMDSKGKLTRKDIKMPANEQDDLDGISTMSKQITVIDDTAYILSLYNYTDGRKSKKLGEIDEIDLKTMEIISRTVIEEPNEHYTVAAFGVLNK